MGKINQRDIVLLNLDPARGREQKGTRPAVIISGNAFHFSGVAIICPITTKIKNYAGDVVLSPNNTNHLKEKSEILVGQIRAVSLERISKKIGTIDDKDLDFILQGFDLLCDR